MTVSELLDKYAQMMMPGEWYLLRQLVREWLFVPGVIVSPALQQLSTSRIPLGPRIGRP